MANDTIDSMKLPTMVELNELEHRTNVYIVKQLRVNLDEQLQIMKTMRCYPSPVVTWTSDEIKQAEIRLKEAIMWCGMELKRLGEANPYPSSYDPSSEVIEPTADGLTM